MAKRLKQAARRIREQLEGLLPVRSEGESKRGYTKRVLAETTEEAYEVVCGVAGCVLKKKD